MRKKTRLANVSIGDGRRRDRPARERKLADIDDWHVRTWKAHNFGKSLTSRSFCYTKCDSMGLNTQFSIATHIMAGLGYAPGAEVNSTLIAGSVNTSPSFVRRTLAKLSKAGLVHTATGKHGTCWLARPPREISLLEIYRAVDAPKAFAIHQYPVERRCTVSCNIKSALSRVLDETQEALEQRLSRISLAQVISDLRRK